ncbi:hypothetical protein JCM5350_003547 [Sporobolomyces pararoseus]
MTAQLNDPASQVEQLSAPSSHAGTAAQPIIELAKEEPRVAETRLPGAYKTGDGVEGLSTGISRLSVQPPSTTATTKQEHAQVGEQVEGIEPAGARKAANSIPPLSSSAESIESKSVVRVVEEKLRTVANTAQQYLPSQETQQQVLDTSKATLTSTVSAASSGAAYAGASIASGAQAVLHAVQPHLPETLGGPHNSANDTTVKEDLDDLVTRAAEAKSPASGETKAITLKPDASTADKEEGKGFDITRTHPEPALDTQQPHPHSDKTTLRQPKIPLDATSPAAITLATASSPTSSAFALAVDKSRSGTASAPPSSPLHSRTEESKPVILPAPVSSFHPLLSLDPTFCSGSPSSTAANFDPTETREKETPSFQPSPSTHRTLDSEKPPLKVIDHPHESSQDKSEVEKDHKHGLKEKIVEKIKSVTHH